MIESTVGAQRAIEALRSGVPSAHAVNRLGTTHQDAWAVFQKRLDQLSETGRTEAMFISGGFGQGKSHLLSALAAHAQREACVTATVVVGPENPLGNAHLILKAIAGMAQAPGRNGSALRELAADYRAESDAHAALRLWARDAQIHERFSALLHLYECLPMDEMFRDQVLADIQGTPLMKGEILRRLREAGQLAGYSLKGPTRNSDLAHDRIRVLARFFHACTGCALVVLFDELERLAAYPQRQRLAAYAEIGWWCRIAETSGSMILPVFSTVTGGFDNLKDKDRPFVETGGSGDLFGNDDNPAAHGYVRMRRIDAHLVSPTREQLHDLQYRVKDLYQEVYSCDRLPMARVDDGRTMRDAVRTWITVWDLYRYYPELIPTVEVDEVIHDDTVVPEEALVSSDSDELAD